MEGQLDPVALVLRADRVVQGVAALLALTSVACWAVIFDRGLRLAAAARQSRRLRRFAMTADARWPRPLPRGLAGAIVSAGLEALRADDGDERPSERRERIERAMRAAMAEELRSLEGGLPFLATVGSTAPFVGLFGTVWGIMHSFSAIAWAEDVSLAVVAPGIAEALFATALGLAVAIPAVVAYNRLSSGLSRTARRLAGTIQRLGDAMARRPAAVTAMGGGA